MATNTNADIAALYAALFGRTPERGGLNYWADQVAHGKSLAQVAQDMYNVEPARAYYPQSLSNIEIIGRFYTNVLGRVADAGGLAYWTAKLDAGMTQGQVIMEMITAVRAYNGSNNAGLTSKALFENKIAVGEYYAVDLGGESPATATAVLSAVTADAHSVPVAELIAANSVGQTGGIPILSAAAEQVTGGAGLDTVTGRVYTGYASAQQFSTLQATDAINGRAGYDTLAVTIDGEDAVMSEIGIAMINVELLSIKQSTNADFHIYLAAAPQLKMVEFNGTSFSSPTNVWLRELPHIVDLSLKGVAQTAYFDLTVQDFATGVTDQANDILNLYAEDVSAPDSPFWATISLGKLNATDFIDTLCLHAKGNMDRLQLDNLGKLSTLNIDGNAKNIELTLAPAPNMAVIDASACSGNLTFSQSSSDADMMPHRVDYFGAAGIDTYFAASGGGLISAGTGADLITLSTSDAADILTFRAGDSMIGGMDVYANFVSGRDRIDVSAFEFFVSQQLGIANKGNINATVATWTALTPAIAGFFATSNGNQALATSSNGTDLYAFADINRDGNFTADIDLAIKLTGVPALTLADIIFQPA